MSEISLEHLDVEADAQRSELQYLRDSDLSIFFISRFDWMTQTAFFFFFFTFETLIDKIPLRKQKILFLRKLPEFFFKEHKK